MFFFCKCRFINIFFFYFVSFFCTSFTQLFLMKKCFCLDSIFVHSYNFFKIKKSTVNTFFKVKNYFFFVIISASFGFYSLRTIHINSFEYESEHGTTLCWNLTQFSLLFCATKYINARGNYFYIWSVVILFACCFFFSIFLFLQEIVSICICEFLIVDRLDNWLQ